MNASMTVHAKATDSALPSAPDSQARATSCSRASRLTAWRSTLASASSTRSLGLRQLPRDLLILELAGEPQSLGHVHQRLAHAVGRELDRRVAAPWSESRPDRLVHRLFERQAPLSHGAPDEQLRIGVQRDRRAHAHIIASIKMML